MTQGLSQGSASISFAVDKHQFSIIFIAVKIWLRKRRTKVEVSGRSSVAE